MGMIEGTLGASEKITSPFTFFLTMICDVLYSMSPLEFTPQWGGVPKAPSRRSVMRRAISLDKFFSLTSVASLAVVLVCLTTVLLLFGASSAFAQEVTAS